MKPVQQRWLERQFKLTIVLVTAGVAAGMVAATPRARKQVGWAMVRARWAALRAVGKDVGREQIEAAWSDRRRQGIAETRATAAQAIARSTPEFQRLLELAGMTAEQAVIRWGNFDRTFLLSARVFEPDDDGRSYRLRPNVRSVWLKQHALPKPETGLLLIPDGAEVRAAAAAARVEILEGSEQATNSWGCRGPEPDREAPVRGLVLGDSFMQGLLVRDAEAPPACLERALSARLGDRVSILNTGVLGYSPEQYFHTLRAFGERFRPQFVVVSVFSNDFGSGADDFSDDGDWSEGRYWLGRIRDYCFGHQMLCLVSPIVGRSQLAGHRTARGYPAAVADAAAVSTELYLDPIEEFLTEYLRLSGGAPPGTSGEGPDPLYNTHLGDGHYNARGTALWGEVLSRRLAPLLSGRRASQASAAR
jgi:hypothetical protein